MDPLSISTSVATLLISAVRVIRAAFVLRSQYKDAASMLSAISSECTVINTSLAMLQSLMVSNLENLRSRMTDTVLSTFEVALMGCAMTMSVIEEELGELLVKSDNGDMKARRIKYIMNEEHLKEMLQQIRGQQIGVTLLLQTYQAESTAEVNDIAQKNNALLRQIANRGRSFYLESIHDSERRTTVAQSFRTNAMSDFEMSSIVDDRHFDFDDEITNAMTYRRALANLRSQGRLKEVGEYHSLSVASEEEAIFQSHDEGIDKELSAHSHDDSAQKLLDLMAATASSDIRSEAPIPATTDTMSIYRKLRQLLDGPLFDTSPLLSEFEFSGVTGCSTQHLATGEVLEQEKRNQPRPTAQIEEVLPKAVASNNCQQTTTSADQAGSPDQIQPLMKEDKGDSTISNFTNASATRPLLPKYPVSLRKLKIVLVGDSAAGKTYALIRHLKGIYVETFCPTRMENYTQDTEVYGCHFRVDWYDTSGMEDYDRILPLSYKGSHVAILFFAIDSPDSLDNIQEKWKLQMDHYLPHVPKILAGCKVDLRYNQDTIEELARTSQKPITRQQGEEVARHLSKASRGSSIVPVEYVECSALTCEGIEKLFQTAIRLGLPYTDSVAVEALAKMQRRVSRIFRRSKAQPQHVSTSDEFIPKAAS